MLDMQLLESEAGVKTNKIKGADYTLDATLLNVIAESMAAHDVLGFVSPSGNFFCRVCMISRDEQKAYLWNAPMQNKQLHQDHVRMLENNQHATTHTGMRGDCVLNKLKYFHCTTIHLMSCMTCSKCRPCMTSN